ncbi:MAG: hypothetical protein KGH65_03715 [Candidatus Micrarchaeota archaeon]|nr:hypothetical protein [Candidatus Micrarchaeota archaeon]
MTDQDKAMGGTNKVTRTAPKRIYLQVSDDSDDCNEPFPIPSEDMTWCEDSVLHCEVEYIRVDLAMHMHPSVRGEKSVAGKEILEALKEHAKGNVGEDAYIRVYPAEARAILKAIGGCDIDAPEPELAAPEPEV